MIHFRARENNLKGTWADLKKADGRWKGYGIIKRLRSESLFEVCLSGREETL